MIHSHVHTCFSAKDSLVRIKDLVKIAKDRGYKALTITDHGSIGGTLDFYDECVANDIKPLIGCEFYLKSETKLTSNPQERMHIIVICKNKTGWNNLLKLTKLSHINSHYVPLTSFDDLAAHSEGLICTTACFAGPLAMPIMNSRYDLAVEHLERLKTIFKDDLYLELQPNSLPSQQTINNSIYDLAIKHNLPYIVGIDTHYIDKSEAKSQETLLGINMKSTILDPKKNAEAENKEDEEPGAKKRYRFAFDSHEFWFMTEEELYKMWDENHKDIGKGVEDGEAPHIIALMKALDNGQTMADKVEKFSIYPDRNHLNMVYDMTSIEDREFNHFLAIDQEHKQQPLSLKFLRFLCHKGIKEKGILNKPNAQEYIDRVKYELKDIEEANIYDYLLIIWDLINFCKSNNIPYGSGRGCLDGDTMVLSSNGFKQLKCIDIGDEVYSHTGNLKKVFNKMEYDIDEDVLKIKCERGFQDLILTKDHKVLAKQRKFINSKKGYEKIDNLIPEWVEAQKLNVGDLIYTPWPKQYKEIEIPAIDLAKYIVDPQDTYDDEYLYLKEYLHNEKSIRRIESETKIKYWPLYLFLRNGKSLKSEYILKLNEYCNKYNLTIDELKLNDNFQIRKIKRFIKIDEDFCYLVGLWIGDGYAAKKPSPKWMLCFNNTTKLDICNWAVKYLESIGFHCSISTYSGQNARNLCVSGHILSSAFLEIFPYGQKSTDKSMGDFININNSLLKRVLDGIIDSDGHMQKYEIESIKTTSLKLALDIKYSLLKLKSVATIVTNENKSKVRNNKISYTLLFKGFKTGPSSKLIYNENGYFVKISKIFEQKLNKVYDISIEDDYSYLTSEGIVHNSASGSLITYLLDAHSADPLIYSLLWERFYNAGRKNSIPDYDFDCSSEQRYKVIEYLVSKYGIDKTAMICNFSFFRPKSTFKAVCKFYGMTYEQVNEALKDGRHVSDDDDDEENGMQDDKEINLSAIKQEMQDIFTIKSVKELLDMNPYAEDIKRDCMSIVGCVSNKSVHACGIVVTASPLVDLCPITTKKSNNKAMSAIEQTTEWDMKMLDRSGFMKLDILALSTVDTINSTIQYINSPDHTMHSWKSLDKNDPEVLKLFTLGQTTGVFQFDYGKELQRLCLEFKPKSFSDICALTALGRPGAKMFLEQYMRNRGKADHEIQLEDPLLKPILHETNYVLAYQEQQMAIAKDLCGFNLKEADDLRKIIAKKQESKIPAMKEKFVKGYAKRTGNEEMANKIWDAYFSNCEYLFNKSHAVAYSFNSYATAYYKRYYPVEFMASVIDANNDGKREKVVPYVFEAMRMKIRIQIPNIRYSPAKTTPDKSNNRIYLGLNTIKDMSDSVAAKFNSRGDSELISTLFNLPKLQYEAMILSGACDGLIKEINRRSLLETVQAYHKLKSDWSEYNKKYKDYLEKIKTAEQKGKKTSAKEPKKPENEIADAVSFPKLDLADFTLQEKIAHEVEYLGYSHSDPDFKYMPHILGTTIHSYRQKETLQNNDVVFIYGEITDVKEKKTANGNDMYTLRIQPKTMQYGFFATCWENKFNKEEMINGAKFIFRMKVNEYIGRDKKLVKGFNVMDYKKADEIWK